MDERTAIGYWCEVARKQSLPRVLIVEPYQLGSEGAENENREVGYVT